MASLSPSAPATSGDLGPPAALLSSTWAPIAARLSYALVGDFEILGELGEGGMAAVFLAHECALNRKVALKVMSPALMMGEGMIERFRQEAVTQANLQHANIVGVHGVRNVDDLHFFVMQFVPGRTLQQVLRAELTAGRYLSIPVIRALLFQVGSALSYAHRRGVIHRDVKPGNILLNGDGDAVVTDFGIAKVVEAPSQTMTGTVVGTPTYMSPEQCFAADLTPASDQYSLGVVAYELITGRTPFQGSSFVLMQAHTTTPPPSISALRPDCPPEVEAAVMRMLAKERDDRFGDLNDALHALGAQATGMRSDDPLRRELQRLADVQGVEATLADVLRGPLSPSPHSKGTARVGGPTAPQANHVTPPPRTAAPSATLALSGSTLPPAPGDSSWAASPSVAAAPVGTPTTSGRSMIALGGGVLAVVAAVGIWMMTRADTGTLPAAGATVGGAPDAATAAMTTGTTTGAPAAETTTGEQTETPPAASPTTPSPVEASAALSATSVGIAIIAPTSRTLPAGERLQLVGRSDRSAGAPQVEWRSGAPTVATVGARTGLVQAHGAGRVMVYLQQGQRRDSLQLSVTSSVATTAGANSAARDSSPPIPVGSRRASPTDPAPVAATPRSSEPSPTTAIVAEKSAAELTAEAQRALATYAEALGSRDTTRIRRAFASASSQLLGQWQSMYDATQEVRVVLTSVQPMDDVVVPTGSTARFRVKQTVTFSVDGSRKAQTQRAEYTAILRREGSGWALAAISDR